MDPAPFRGAAAVSSGRATRAHLRSRAFVALHHDTYVAAAVPPSVRRRVAAVGVRAGPGAVVAGPLAAVAWGAECPWDDAAEAILPTDRRLARDGIRLRVDRLDAGDVTQRFGVTVTTPLRTALDLACRAPLADAVAAVDALARAGGFRSADLAALVARHRGRRGIVTARLVVDLMDPRAESLMESRTRVGLVLRGVPRPVLQHPVRLADGRTVFLDLAWPDPPSGRPTAVEYQGEHHRSLRRHGLDIDRTHGLEDLGWYIMEVTARQVFTTLDDTAARLRRRLGV